MHERGKSDSSIVPGKPSNNGERRRIGHQGELYTGTKLETAETAKSEPTASATASGALAEEVEGRELAKGNSVGRRRVRTQRRAALKQATDRIREAARRERRGKLTSLWHHVCAVDRLHEAYLAISPKAAAGVDGETWSEYGEDLERKLFELSERLRSGGYRPQPVRRVYIPKSDGRQRPIGVPALEDKIVQRATAEVLGAVYETDFKGFSYGFRPGRSQHDALDALWVGLVTRPVNWVLDLDIRGFYDAINHECLERFIEHRIGDRRVLRHVRKWLRAGVMEEGNWRRTTQGTPQGGSVSPILSNIYLHYAFDQWADQWRKREATGEVIIIRYADDVVVGFQHWKDAARFQRELRERLGKFSLELNEEKTRLMEFGRYAAERRARRGMSRPETFVFLGFVHICGESRQGKYVVRRKTEKGRMRRTLQRVKLELRRRMHAPVYEQGRWLGSVVRGHCGYYGVPGNRAALEGFRMAVIWQWYRRLSRRSQKNRLTMERMLRLAKRWLPNPRIAHQNPMERLSLTQGRSPVR